MDTVEVLANNKEARNSITENDIEILDSFCDDAIRRSEDAPFVGSEEETEASGATEAVESGETKKNSKRKRSSSCPSKKAARLAEETKRQLEEAATAVAQAKAEARQHEIDLAHASHSEVLIKDCTFNLTCCDSNHKPLIKTIGSMVKACDNSEFKEAILKAVSATETPE